MSKMSKMSWCSLTMSISGVLDNSWEEERLGWIHIISGMYRKPAFVARTKHTIVWKVWGKNEKNVKKSWEKFIRIIGKCWEQLLIASWKKLKNVGEKLEQLEKVKGSDQLCKVVELRMQCCGQILQDLFETYRTFYRSVNPEFKSTFKIVFLGG